MSNETFVQKFEEFKDLAEELFGPNDGFMQMVYRDGASVGKIIEYARRTSADETMKKLAASHALAIDEVLQEGIKAFTKYVQLEEMWHNLVWEIDSGTKVSQLLQELQLTNF